MATLAGKLGGIYKQKALRKPVEVASLSLDAGLVQIKAKSREETYIYIGVRRHGRRHGDAGPVEGEVVAIEIEA